MAQRRERRSLPAELSPAVRGVTESILEPLLGQFMEDFQVQTGPGSVLQGQAKLIHNEHKFPEDTQPPDPLLLAVPWVPHIQHEHPGGTGV